MSREAEAEVDNFRGIHAVERATGDSRRAADFSSVVRASIQLLPNSRVIVAAALASIAVLNQRKDFKGSENPKLGLNSSLATLSLLFYYTYMVLLGLRATAISTKTCVPHLVGPLGHCSKVGTFLI
jgi:hypothetical protein